MKKLVWMLVIGASGGSMSAQPSEPAPQSARQALIEMFFDKTPGTFAKHLPAATLSALDQSGASQKLQQYSLLAGQLHSAGKQIETFATGSVLLTSDDARTGQKFEVLIESDSLQGDEDNIEVSLHSYKEEQIQRTPFMPRLVFSMKMESGIWKLNEISISVRFPLADPDFLKSITDGIKSAASKSALTATAGAMPLQAQPQTGSVQKPAIVHAFDSSIFSAMSSITSAEAIYSATYRTVGYTCTLSDLDGFGGGEPNEHQAMLIPSTLASGKKYGYEFNLSGCNGSPSPNFQLTAAPRSHGLGRRAFCADKSGVIRSSDDGNPASCLASGIPVQ